jgi:hypothetical protein
VGGVKRGQDLQHLAVVAVREPDDDALHEVFSCIGHAPMIG